MCLPVVGYIVVRIEERAHRFFIFFFFYPSHRVSQPKAMSECGKKEKKKKKKETKTMKNMLHAVDQFNDLN